MNMVQGTSIKGITKEELLSKMKAGLTHELIAKLGRGESVHLDALLKICKVLDCELNDIMEVKFIREEN